MDESLCSNVFEPGFPDHLERVYSLFNTHETITTPSSPTPTSCHNSSSPQLTTAATTTPNDKISCVKFHPDGQRFAIGTFNGKIILFSTAFTSTPIATYNYVSFRDDRRRRMKFGEKHEPHEIRDITFQQWNNREYMLSVSANATVCLWETSKNIVTNSIQLPLSGFRFQNIALATTPSAAYQVVIYGSLGQYPLILNVRTENYKSLDVTAMLNGDVHADKIKTCDYLIAFTQPHGNIMHIATSMGHLIALQIQNKNGDLLSYHYSKSALFQNSFSGILNLRPSPNSRLLLCIHRDELSLHIAYPEPTQLTTIQTKQENISNLCLELQKEATRTCALEVIKTYTWPKKERNEHKGNIWMDGCIGKNAKYIVGLDNMFNCYIWELDGDLLAHLPPTLHRSSEMSMFHMERHGYGASKFCASSIMSGSHKSNHFVLISSLSQIQLWGNRLVGNWSSFAPAFKCVHRNVELEEREDEFDYKEYGGENIDIGRKEENQSEKRIDIESFAWKEELCQIKD